MSCFDITGSRHSNRVSSLADGGEGVRVLLGTLLLVALAVVPYLSLRLAQVTDRTLVVFQPVPVRNHSLHHHHAVDHGKISHVDVVSFPSAVTLAVMEDTNATRKRGNESEVEEAAVEEDAGPKAGVEEDKKEPEENATTEDAASTSEAPASIAQVAAVTDQASPSTPPAVVENNTGVTPANTTGKAAAPSASNLVYMSTSASGNHVGGFCVWKTDKNVTRWSYFYENIPIEYQSHQDSSDHEMRGMLAAVRTWAPLWNDHHVVLRSHHPAINGADHPTRRALTRELERLSNGRFTYELEWRLKKTDRVVDIAYCLSRLHRDFAHWFRTFEGRVDELLGRQVWATARIKNRTPIEQDAFLTDDPEDEEIRGDK
ncbi:hypothetical protein C7M84_012026 [Penaeus vannamei]|uniref:Uncharacterized protein n=1 Tax=Penaeus vannamei TaxID=6689 RepID=A0A3R7Q6E1_PENVA|nr:hypothetical protein C7M84_012026 [Penaeus vannamei]